MKRRNRLITLLSLVFVLSMALSLALTAFGAVAETLNPTLFKMKEGASIRVSEPTGLRFIAEVDAQTVAAVEGDANSCFGALIVPSDYFNTYGISDDNGTDFIKEFEAKSVTVSKKENLAVSALNASGNHYVACSMTSIYFKNINREFFGIVYIKTVDAGVTSYVYADFINESNERSAEYVAYRTYQEYKEDLATSEDELLKTYMAKGYLDDGSYEDDSAISNAAQSLVASDVAFKEVLTALEVKEVKALTNKLPEQVEDVTAYDGENIANVAQALDRVSEEAKAGLTSELAQFNTIKEYYDARYIKITGNGNWVTNGTTGTYATKQSIAKEYNDTYGSVMQVKIVAPETDAERNLRINLSLGLVEDAMSADEDVVAVRFMVNSTALSHTYSFLNGSYMTKNANEWKEITLTREQILNGTDYSLKVIELKTGEAQEVLFTNFYAIKSQAIVEETISAIGKLPQTVENVKAFDGESIQNATALYSMLSESAQSQVTNKEVLTMISADYNSKFGVVNAFGKVWTTAVNSGTWGSQYTSTLEQDATYGTVVRLDIAQGTSSAANFRVTLPISAIKSVLNADASIAEVKFAVYSTATQRRFEMNATSGFVVPQNTWTECTLTRAEALASNGNFQYGSLVSASAHTVKISGIYVVKAGPIVEEVISLINTIPQTTSDVDMFDGSKINSVYTVYNNLPEAYKSFVTNASVLTAVKEHYDANYGIVFDETSVWLNSGKTGNYAGVGTRELAVDSDYGTVIKCEVEQKDESVANSERFSVLTPTALYNLVNGDSSITEVKFMFRVSKKLSGNVYFNGSNSSCEADTWTEYTLSRDAIIAKGTSGIRLTFLSLANDSAQTVYFTNFYYVKSAS